MPHRLAPPPLLARPQELLKRLDEAQWPTPALIIGGFIYTFLGWPSASYVFIGTLIVLLIACWRYAHSNFLDLRIRAVFRNVRRWSCYHRFYPRYKWVDIYCAAQALAAEHPGSTEIVAACNISLQQLLLGRGIALPDRRSSPVVQISCKTGHTTETFLPSDTLWLIHADGQHSHGDCIIRVRYIASAHSVLLEVAVKQ